ncbi:hypothetical protein EV384_5402 [Micromonospora kangleipakensis]|uniref:Uncharacterized protein n=1 Tax=Micromonospora kangleipakensis TaxID=1077942 RepID=A0A4V2GDP7_9ACTN|nr:hypothetical protein [Micromonospora kangleipakensis]RZU76726.1 hypothetical protein EV384_5402 [Micromonospora kangleipakensis]
MYRYLANKFASPPDLFLVHPLQLSRWLETAWAAAPNVPVIGNTPRLAQLGSTTVIADFDMPETLLRTLEPGVDLARPGDYTPPGRQNSPLLSDHLMYAYLIESTGIWEIIAKILSRIMRGETLGRLRPETLQWARAMEELLFRAQPNFSIAAIESRLRSDIRCQRRNAYWRMFAFDLPHPMPSSCGCAGGASTPCWKVDVGNGVNTAFGGRLNELFTQVWTGYENKVNQVGANATDAQYVGLLAEAIDDMLGNRRQGGLLAREEQTFVAGLSLCHLTVEYDTPVVQDLQATATSPAERLAKLGERVGMTPAPRSRELFELAEPMSSLLWGIELGLFNPGGAPESLYLPNVPNGPPTTLNIEVNRIIDLWQSATGTRIKTTTSYVPGAPAAPRPPAQPLRVPTPAPGPAAPALAAASTNGHRT